MRKLFLFIAVFVMALCANAQTNQYFWYQGNLMMGNPIAQIDSVTFGEGEPADTLHILLPRTIIKTVEVHDTVYITIHDTVCPNAIPEGALAGEFSVSATKKVRFSKGNLQCIMADTIWRFADNQWETIGKRNTNIETWGDTIDLFGWSSPNNYYGITMSENDNDYDGLFVEWGTLIGDNWRTLSGAEWNYLVRSRNNHEILIAVGSVNGINGCIILPDTWIIPQGISFNSGTAAKASVDAYSTVNTYSKEEWKKMEDAGAIFLPAASIRRGAYYDSNLHQYFGRYWGSTRTYETTGQAHSFGYDSSLIDPQYDVPHYGFSVRLVQDVEE